MFSAWKAAATIGAARELGARLFTLPKAAASIGDNPPGRRPQRHRGQSARSTQAHESCACGTRGTHRNRRAASKRPDLSTGSHYPQARLERFALGATPESSQQTFAAAEPPSGNGVVLEATTTAKRRTSARMNVRKRMERVEKEEVRRRKPNPLSRTVRRNRSLRAKETAKGTRNGSNAGRNLDRKLIEVARFRWSSGQGTGTRPQGIERKPRDRPGPKGRPEPPRKRLCPHRLRT